MIANNYPCLINYSVYYMKRTSIYYFSFAAILAGSFASCQDDDRGFTEEEIRESAILREYQKNFTDRYGVVDPNHTWGFGSIGAQISSVTRAVNTQSNLWYATYGLNVPGQPHHLHGNFVGTNSTDKTMTDVATYYNPTQVSEFQNKFANNVGNAIGDVTPEERDYVFNYFNTAVRPSDEIHWSEFFIQYVDCWNERFPQEPQRNMDQLGCQAIDGSWEHINDFNGTTRSIKYVQNAGTEAWSYKTSHADGSVSEQDVFDRYRMYHIVFDIELEEGDCEYNCDIHHYDGWYIGFDYHSIKGDVGDVKADGKYIDWIVKVSPGTFNRFSASKRVMCEDLGNTFDFDFNDVVFDVMYEQTSGYWAGDPNATFDAIITLQASGGTLPIYVGVDPADDSEGNYEAHRLMGNSSDTPLNVGGETGAVSVYRIKNVSSSDPDDITIYVMNQGQKFQISKAGQLSNILKDPNSTYNKDDKGTSMIPQKFCVPTIVLWMQESQQIEDGYTYFSNYVQNATQYATWYETVKNPSLLFAPTQNVVVETQQQPNR